MFQILVCLLACFPSVLCTWDRWYPIEQLEHHPAPFLQPRVCGTSHPPDHLAENLKTLHEIEPLDDNNLWSPKTFSRQILSQPLHKRQSSPLITIPLHIHIVSTTNATRPTDPLYTTDKQISDQFAYLNTHFSPISVTFTLESTTRTTNDDWASGLDQVSMKTTLRNGTYRHLNLYLQSNLKSDGSDGTPAGQILLGICSLPVDGITPQSSRDSYVRDGCSILSSVVTGGSFAGYNLGGTAVHEIGHWFGLLHTFQGESCDVDDWGDFVADTPQQKNITSGCPRLEKEPREVDSCPVSGKPEGSWDGKGANPFNRQGYSGVDNQRNWMDYSADRCYEAFSAGQGARVINAYNLWRKGR